MRGRGAGAQQARRGQRERSPCMVLGTAFSRKRKKTLVFMDSVCALHHKRTRAHYRYSARAATMLVADSAPGAP